MDPLKMIFLLKMGIFHCYVSLLEGNYNACITGYEPYFQWIILVIGGSWKGQFFTPQHGLVSTIPLPVFFPVQYISCQLGDNILLTKPTHCKNPKNPLTLVKTSFI